MPQRTHRGAEARNGPQLKVAPPMVPLTPASLDEDPGDMDLFLTCLLELEPWECTLSSVTTAGPRHTAAVVVEPGVMLAFTLHQLPLLAVPFICSNLF